jgi:hypothetical protein
MNQPKDQLIDRLAKAVARGGGIGAEESERLGSGPHLHARIRAGIEAERQHRAEEGSGWLATLLVASRAIAALVLVTIATVVMFWLTKSNSSVTPPAMNAKADDISRVVTGGTCALSATDECAISTEEVLATLFAENGGKEQK